MKVFISWSGGRSRKLALALKGWLPCVLDNMDPFVSSEDIRRGKRWVAELADTLEKPSFGVACLLPENLSAEWIHFEAGALSKHVESSHFCPILFGLRPADVTGPLTQFNMAEYSQEEMLKLVKSLNAAQGDEGIAEATLKRKFDKWWPDFENAVKTLLSEGGGSAKPAGSGEPVRHDRELLEEIVERVREIGDGRSSELPRLNNMRKIGDAITACEALVHMTSDTGALAKIGDINSSLGEFLMSNVISARQLAPMPPPSAYSVLEKLSNPEYAAWLKKHMKVRESDNRSEMPAT